MPAEKPIRLEIAKHYGDIIKQELKKRKMPIRNLAREVRPDTKSTSAFSGILMGRTNFRMYESDLVKIERILQMSIPRIENHLDARNGGTIHQTGCQFATPALPSGEVRSVLLNAEEFIDQAGGFLDDKQCELARAIHKKNPERISLKMWTAFVTAIKEFAGGQW